MHLSYLATYGKRLKIKQNSHLCLGDWIIYHFDFGYNFDHRQFIINQANYERDVRAKK